MRLLVAGGTGFLGRHLVARLSELGHEPIVVSRGGPLRYEHLPQVSDVDAVINLAGESIVGRWTAEKKRRVMASRVETTRKLVDWMSRQPTPIRVFLSASGVGYYGDRPNETLTEVSPPDPRRRFRAQVCESWEAEACQSAESGTRVVLLRLGCVLDAEDGLLGGLRKLARSFPAMLVPAPETPLSWISRQDAIEMIVWALEDSRVQGPLNVTAPQATTIGQLAAWLARLERRFILGRLPLSLTRAALGEFGESILDRQQVLPAKAEALGYRFQHPTLDSLMGT